MRYGESVWLGQAQDRAKVETGRINPDWEGGLLDSLLLRPQVR